MFNYQHTSSYIDQEHNTTQLKSFQKFFDTFPLTHFYWGIFQWLWSPFNCFLTPMSSIWHEHVLISELFFQQLFHTSLGSYSDQEHMLMHLDNNKQLFHASLGSCNNQKQIWTTYFLLKRVSYTSLRSCNGKGHIKLLFIQFIYFIHHYIF